MQTTTANRFHLILIAYKQKSPTPLQVLYPTNLTQAKIILHEHFLAGRYQSEWGGYGNVLEGLALLEHWDEATEDWLFWNKTELES
ncbi:hypothetical protein FACS18948_7180 [Clostridia bacterium]|nr:hypothetical protein FACS18948_7180 [Clostridia bacterium]